MRDVRAKFAARHATTIATVPWQERSPTSVDDLTALISAADGIDLTGLTGRG